MAAAVALAVLSLVAAPGARGVLGDGRSLAPVMLAALGMHVVAWGCRRRLGHNGSLVALLATPVLVAWLALPGTTVLGIPWSDTVRAAARGTRRALEALATGLPARADEPEVLQDGRLVLAVLLVAVCALLADLAAFRVRRASVALVPSFTLLLVGVTRAPSDRLGAGVAAYLVAAMAFLLLHHTMALQGSAVVGGDRSGLRLTRAGPAAVLAAVAVVVAMLAAPLLPGYGSPAVVASVRSGDEARSALRLSGLVDVNPALTEQSDVVMFTVASPVPTYWRLTSLDRFDGERWTQGDDDGTATPPGLLAAYANGVSVVQDYEIEGLRSDWLPAAYRPQRVDGVAASVAGGSSTLRPRDSVGFGQRYQVVSLLPRLTGSELRLLSSAVPDPALAPYREVPPGVSRRVLAEAARIVGSVPSASAYDAALALQAYFRDNFTYDLEVGASADDDALVDFLFRTRRGYCEQFAAAFAVMARAVGLPARVAVGFTPGDRGADGRYVVRGLNAHAWPEVHLDEAGWLAFEPTPERGMPGAEAYTGVGPAQASRGGADPAPPGAIPTSSATSAATTVGSVAPATVPPSTPPSPATTAPDRRSPPPARPGRGPVALVAGAVAVAVLFAGVPLAKQVRRRARRRRAAGPNERVMVAWAEAAEALAAAGVARRPCETLLEHAARAAGDERLADRVAEPVLVLAGRAGTVSYSRREVDAGEAADCDRAAAAVGSAVRSVTPLHRRVAHAVDPRPLLSAPRRQGTRRRDPTGGGDRAGRLR